MCLPSGVLFYLLCFVLVVCIVRAALDCTAIASAMLLATGDFVFQSPER